MTIAQRAADLLEVSGDYESVTALSPRRLQVVFRDGSTTTARVHRGDQLLERRRVAKNILEPAVYLVDDSCLYRFGI